MNKIYRKIAVALALLASLSACESFVNGVDEFDPNLPRDASLSQVLTSVEVSYLGFVEGDIARIAGIFTDQFTGSDRQYVSYDQYITTSGDYDSQWDNIYSVALKGLRIVQTKATESNSLSTKGLAQILEAHIIGMTAALFGDVPYSQIVQIEEYTNPVFDSQEDIYTNVIALLDDGIANINSGGGGLGSILGGASADWIARANTLKAKFYLHMGDYANAIAAANEGISDPASDLIGTHGGNYNTDINLYASFVDWDRPGYMSAEGAHAPLMLDPDSEEAFNRNNAKTDESARFNYIYLKDQEIYNSGYELNFFDEANYGEPAGYFGAVAPWHIITYKENQLILAEAELRLNGFNNGLEKLNELRAELNTGAYINPDYTATYSYLYADYNILDFAPLGIENPDGLAPEDALYREIIEEKYVSLLGHLEVFNDMRRSGFGSFASQQNWQVIGVPLKGSSSTIPQRLLISQNEINSNTSVPSSLPGLFEKGTLPK